MAGAPEQGERRGRRRLWHAPASVAIRLAASAMAVAGLGASMAISRKAARAFAHSPWNRKRLVRAERNLADAFPEWSADRVREYAVRSYEHLFTLAAEISLAQRLFTDEGWISRVTLGDVRPEVAKMLAGGPVILITGHCGNWELMGYTIALLGFPMHALYRPIDLTPLDNWVREVRERRGLALVDKFGALKALPELLKAGAPMGFVADQNGGDRGVFVPFFNRLTSTYKSIGLLALQFGCTIMCAYARRLEPPEAREGDLRYRIDIEDMFGPAEWSAHADPLFYLSARYRHAIERMIRRAPDQYDWMHRVWRSRPVHERLGKPFPPALREKVRTLPWITEEGLARIEEFSARDTRTLAETGMRRLA